MLFAILTRIAAMVLVVVLLAGCTFRKQWDYTVTKQGHVTTDVTDTKGGG